MEAGFWEQVWEESSSPPFNRAEINPYVKQYASASWLAGKRVLVPLCGKSKDLLWFRQYADHVVGVELVEKPVQQFFAENQLAYQLVKPRRYEAERITILQEDMFAVQAEDVGKIDVVYDRAAMIALPPDMRQRYARKIDSLLLPGARILLNVIEYLPLSETPPFSVSADEVYAHFGEKYQVEHLEKQDYSQSERARQGGRTFLLEHLFLLEKVRS